MVDGLRDPAAAFGSDGAQPAPPSLAAAPGAAAAPGNSEGPRPLACSVVARRVAVELGRGRGVSAVWLPPGLEPSPHTVVAAELPPAPGGGGAPPPPSQLRLFVFERSTGRLVRFEAEAPPDPHVESMALY